MALEREGLRELTDLTARLVDELRQVRAQNERQTAVLERLLNMLASLERPSSP